jgi:hypothetical protein
MKNIVALKYLSPLQIFFQSNSFNVDRKNLTRYLSLAFALLLVFASMNLYAQTTYFSRSPGGNWNNAATWSTVAYDDPTNTGSFPVAGDFVFIGGTGSTVTITGAIAACATLDIADNSILNVGNGLTVSGTTTVGSGSSGVLSINSTANTKIFIGLVTINNGATWNETVNEAIVFRGGITNNGVFSAGTGVHTFNTNSQALTGTFIIPSVTVTGGAVVLTNNNSLTVNTALSGTGRITQGAGATLNIGGTSAITNMTATASGNTVNYTGAAQTVNSNAYDNLGLSGSGVKTLQAGTTAITGDLILSGTVSTTGVTGMTIGGDLNIGSGTSFTSGAFTHNVGGDFTNNGTFTGTGSTIIFTGAGQNITGGSTTFNDVTLSGSGTKTFGVSPTLAIGGTLSINNGVIADLSNANTHTSNALILGGAIQQAGTWGSSSSAATNQNDTFFSGNGLITVATGANTYYSIASTAWNVNTTWSNVGFGGPAAAGTPGPSDFVFIGGGFSVSIAGAETCSALLFDAGTSVTNTLTISSGSLTVSGAVTIPQTVTSGSNILNVGAGTLTASSLDFTSTPGGAGQFMIISTGTATISGNITGIGASSTIQFTGTGLLQVGGSMFTSANGTLTSVAGSTVEYNGAAQTVQALGYNNLTLSGSGTKTLAANTTVGGNLAIGDGVTFTIGAFTFAVTGTTTVGAGTTGTLSIASATGTKTFTGLVTINNGATWTNTTEAVTFQGGITNNGTFSPGTGVQTFNTNSQTLTGTFTIPSVTVTGGAVVLTNTNTLTVGTALSGTGRITQGAGATLNIGGTSAITNMTATASGNTVNYTGAAQTVHNNAYDNLGLSGSGVKTLQVGTTAITGDLILSGTVSATGVIGMTIGGDVNIGSGTSFTSGAFTHNVGGDWTNSGTFTGTGSTIIFDGAAQIITGGSTTFNDVTLSGSGTKTFSVSPTLAIAGTLSINNGVIADLSNANTHTSNALILGGAIQQAGTWGSTSSAATNQNDTFFSGNGLITVATGANTYYSIASTAWNVNTTWSNVGFGGAAAAGTPGAGDFVYIGDGFSVTIAGAETCDALFFDAGTSVTNTLTISSGSLTVSGAVTIPQTVTSGSNILNVGAGTLTASSLDFTSTPGGAGQFMIISTGTATISGNITGIGASSTVQFTGTGLLQVGGSMFTSANGTLTSVAGSTVEYNGAAQTVQALAYSNLTLSGSGTKTLATPATTTTVSGNLVIADGTTFSIGSITSLSISGTTTVGAGTSGTLLITSTAGTKTFTGLVTVNAGALWNETANEAVTFQGGITNNGTFTAGTGVHTFNTNSQTLTGIFSIPNVTVTGAAIVLTNTNALTVGTALSGTGGITQGAGATLNIGGASAITNMTATASGNTVNYTGAAQTVHNNTYDNLGLSGSGVKTLQLGTTAITGDFILSGTVSATGVIGMTIGGDVNIGSGTSFTSGAFTHNVGGDWTNNGTFVGTASGAINLNGAGQNITGGSTTFNDLVLSGSGTKVFGVSTTIMDGLSINTGVVADLGIFTTHTANTLTLGGVLQTTGTWGSSGSAAANQNDTFFLIASSGEIAIAVGGNTFYSIASTAWNVNTTWSNTGFGGLPAAGTPGAGDLVYIGGGLTVTIAGAETCSELFFDAGTSVTNTLTITSGSLTVSGTVTIPQTVTSGSNIMNVGAGTLTAGDIDFTATGSGAGHQMTISTGTATVIGNITGIGSSSTIQFTGAGLLQVGGLMFTSANGTLTSVAGSTVEYTGAAQTVQALGYNNLTLSGSGTKTLAGNTTVGGNLVIGDGVTFTIGAFTSAVTGTTTVGAGTSGTLSITSTAGTKTFTGLVTINAGGLWNETVNEAVTFQGGITNNGTFTAGTAVHTFNTNSQTLTGTFSIPSVTVTGGAVVLTNTNTLTVGTALSGTGGITQGAGATLNIGGTNTITNMTATASGNTVNYTGAAQTIHSNNYVNLGLAGSGAKTLQAGTTAITGNLVLSGTVSTTGVTGLTIGGNVNIGAGTTFSSGAFDHTIGGDWINDGTFNHNNRLITFSGTSTQSIQGVSATTFYNLRIEDGPASPDVQLDQTAGVNLVGEMTFEDNAIFDADGTGSETFTVISTVTGDGRIGPLGGTADVTGNVTVQRYMDAEGKIYRYISTPVDNPTAEDLQGEIPITGPFTGSSFPPQTGCTNCAPCTGCVLNNTSMYRYEETIVAALNNRYTPFPSSGGINSETMLPGRGYAVYVRNDVSATTWDLRAELNKGEVDLNPSITGSNDGFNLVGNPYASPIDWESASWTRNGGIDPTIYIWDNSISNYASYTIGGGSTNGGSRYIAMGQAFWVLASGTPDLRAQEGIKANQGSVAQAEFFRVAKPVDNLRIKLIASNSSDEVLIRLNQNGASANFDVRMDALEFPSDTLLSLHSITTDKKQLAVNVLGPQQKNTTEIQLGLSGVKSGSFTIDFLEFTNFSAQTKVYLLDRFTDDLMEIQLANKQYSFGVTSDPASAGDKRFVVYLTRNGEKPEMSSDFEAGISVFPNPTTDKITVQVKSQERVSAGVLNALGIQVTESIELVKSGTKSVGQFDMSAMAPGVYILQIKSGRNIVNQRIVKK